MSSQDMIHGVIGGLKVGDRYPVRVMGVINVSPESFYKPSIKTGYEEIARTAREMVKLGADIIDVGAMSTAPYLETWIDEELEAKRLADAVEAVKGAVKAPISADTSRLKPAVKAIEAGAEIINDVRGLGLEPRLASLVADHGLSLILSANKIGSLSSPKEAPDAALRALRRSLKIAVESGVDEERVAVDPGIGFHRSTGIPWFQVDYSLLRGLGKLRALGRPILVGVSRKSFLGAITGRRRPEERLAASIAAEAVAVIYGAHIIRTHDVPEAVDAVRVAEAIAGRMKT